MSIARIRSRVSGSVGSRTPAGAAAASCTHRDPGTLAQQWLQLLLPESSQRTPISRARQSSQHIARPSFTQRSLHTNAEPRPDSIPNHARNKPVTKNSWEIPTSSKSSSTISQRRRQESPSGTQLRDTHINKHIQANSTTPGRSYPSSTAQRFIPEKASWDPKMDYWKLYQTRLDSKMTIKDGELTLLSQWLSATASNSSGINKDLATKLTILMKELRRRPNTMVSNDHYNDLIHYHIKRTKYQEAQRIIDLMVEERRVKKKENTTFHPRTLALLMAMHLKSGNESSLQALTNKDQNTEIDRLFMEQFLKWSKGLQLTGEHIQRVKDILRDVQRQSCPPNTKRFTGRLNAHFVNGRHEEALALMNHVLDIGFPANEYTSSHILAELLKVKRYDDALQIWTKIQAHPDSTVNVSAHNTVLAALCHEPSRFSTAQTMWSELLKISTLKPDLYSFSIMLNGSFRAKDPVAAMNLWELMQKEPYLIKPNPILYNIALMGLFHNHQPEMAKRLYLQMVEIEQGPEKKEDEGLQPIPLDTCNIMIRGLLSVQDLDGLNKVLTQMEHTGTQPDATTYTTITDILFSQRDKDSANKVVELMTSHKVHKTAITYSAVIAGLVNVGDIDRAKSLFEEMQGAGFPPSVHTYGAMIQGALKAGDVPLAEDMAHLAKTRTKEGLSMGAYSILISGYAKLLMIDRAEHWFDEMCQSLSHYSSTTVSSSRSCSRGSSNSNRDITIAGSGVISLTENKNRIPWTVYYVLLKSCVEHQLWAPAERILARMKELEFQSKIPKLTVLIREVEEEGARRSQSGSQLN
ncbi:hypothetical protein BGX28_002474 [Mortierella sp. GBA30]|nr:hypothetical protein BGX28_002474 [Mortierella sp. GBA30]